MAVRHQRINWIKQLTKRPMKAERWTRGRRNGPLTSAHRMSRIWLPRTTSDHQPPSTLQIEASNKQAQKQVPFKIQHEAVLSRLHES